MAENHAHQLKRKSISDQIFDILKEKILSNQWKPGDKIPSETELAASFGVSRLSARTAIQRLSALGLVEIRVGDGTYIKDYPLDNLLTEGSELLLSVREEDEMGDFRGLFEHGYMTLACANRTQEDIDRVAEIMHRLEACAEEGQLEHYLETDNELHRTLCDIARNQYFSMVYKLMEKTFIAQYRINTEHFSRLPENSRNVSEENYYLKRLAQGHRSYLDALVKRDPCIANDYMGTYLQRYRDGRHREETGKKNIWG